MTGVQTCALPISPKPIFKSFPKRTKKFSLVICKVGKSDLLGPNTSPFGRITFTSICGEIRLSNCFATSARIFITSRSVLDVLVVAQLVNGESKAKSHVRGSEPLLAKSKMACGYTPQFDF